MSEDNEMPLDEQQRLARIANVQSEIGKKQLAKKRAAAKRARQARKKNTRHGR